MASLITKKRRFLTSIKAFSLIEILLAIFVFSLFSTGMVYLSLDTASRAVQVELKNEALLYAEEGIEAARNIRDRNYLDLVAGSYGLSFSSDTWSLGAAPETIDGYYQRTVLVEDVYRDGNGDIVPMGALDPETKKVTVTVDWNWKALFPKSISLVTYLTNWTGDEWMQTTCTEFAGGTFTDTSALASIAPPADNCTVELTLVEGQSDFFCSVEAGSHGTDIVMADDYAYFTTGNSGSGLITADMSALGEAESENCDDEFDEKEVDIGGKGRFLVKSGNYLYIGVQSSSKGLAVVDVSDPDDPDLVRQINLGGYGNQPFVSGNTLFMGVEKSSNSFVAYDISSPSNPVFLGAYNPSAATRTVEINGNYAYIGIDNASSTLRVVDISNPSSMSSVASLNLSGRAYALEYYSSVLYAGTDSATSSLKVINLSNPLSPTLSSSMNVGGSVQDLKVEGGYLYAPTDVTNNALAVLNVSTPLGPEITYYADLSGKGTGVDTNADRVFLSIDTANEGLVIRDTVNVELASPGTFTSEALDTGSVDTRFNFIEWEATVPMTGSISFQLRTANSSAALSSATWVGSDGTSATSYTTSPTVIVLDPARSGNRFIQVKITMTSDGVSTPALESFSVNYNP
jgi:type II secretory pathway pseudopilin PulG